jgi:hypothetical protein
MDETRPPRRHPNGAQTRAEHGTGGGVEPTDAGRKTDDWDEDRSEAVENLPNWRGRYQGATCTVPRDQGRFVARPEPERFWAKVHKTPGGCWLWTGTTNADGYGLFRVKRAGRWLYVKTHRWAWEHLVGPLQSDWTLDHLTAPGPCTSTACVRPDHLEEVTRAENARRAARRRRRQHDP